MAPGTDPSPDYPDDLDAAITLTDGTICRVRPIRPDDAAALVAFHQGLSLHSTYLRFFTVHPTLTATEVHHFTTVDYRNRLALVVESDGKLLAVGRYDRAEGDAEAEVAFVVADAYQGHGLGSLLLDELARAGRCRGIHEFVAQTLFENKDMLDVFHHSGFQVSSTIDCGVVWLRFGIGMTPAYRAIWHDRERRLDLRRLPADVSLEEVRPC